MSKRAYMYGIGGFLLVIVIFAHFFLGSLWFIWALLSSEGFQRSYALDNRSIVSQLSSGIPNTVLAHAPEISFLRFSKRMGYTGTGSYEEVVVLPRLGKRKEAIKSLQDDSWSIRKRLGFYIIASKGDYNASEQRIGKSQEVFRVIKRFYQNIYHSKVLFPTALAQININDDSLVVLLLKDHSNIRLFAKKGVTSFAGINSEKSIKTEDQPEVSSNGILVTLSGSDLQKISKQSLGQLKNNLNEVLHLSFSSPDITSLVGKFKKVGFINTGTDGAVGIKGLNESEAKELLKELVINEINYRAPVKKAFRLPDNSIGFQLVPQSSTQLDWAIYGPNCSVYKGQEFSSWLCVDVDSVVLGSSQQSAELLIKNLNKEENIIQIGSEDLRSLLGLDFKYLSATVSNEDFQVLFQGEK